MRFNNHMRNTEPELMDDPYLDSKTLDIAVADVNKCNAYLGGYGFTTRALRKIISKDPDRSYRITDVGCSDGAMLRHLSDAFPDFDLEFTGIDLSARSIEQASLKSKGYNNINYKQVDIFKEPLKNLESDIVLVTLTLHHFPEETILDFIKRFMDMSTIAVIINDLHRHRIAYNFFKIFSPIFIGNHISIHDGLISIASGFKKEDFERYAKNLNIKNDQLNWKWSFRYLWIIPTHER